MNPTKTDNTTTNKNINTNITRRLLADYSPTTNTYKNTHNI